MLINCVAYEDGTKLADCPIDDISEYVSAAGLLRLGRAASDATADELAKMQEEFGLHELAVEDARHGHQRPKIEEYGDTLFAVLHTVEIGEGRRAGDRRARRVRRPELRALGAQPDAGRFPRRARARRARAAPAQARPGVRLLRADGRRRRPLLPDHRRARDRARVDRGRRSSSRISAASTSSGSTRSSARSASSSTRSRRCRKRWPS